MRLSTSPAAMRLRGLQVAWAVCLVVVVAAVWGLTHPRGPAHIVATPPAVRADLAPTPTRLGIAFPADIYWDRPSETAASLDLAAGTGIRSVRIPIFWGLVQPVDARSYYWQGLDRVVADATARGLSILGSVGSTPAWAAAPGSSGPYAQPASASAFAAFVAAVAKRYRGAISAYEIWNEPNGSIFFDPRPDPVAYTALLKAGYRAVKDADPAATVVGGALGAVVTSGVTADPVAFLSRMYDAGAAGSFDALSFHPYKYDMTLASAWTLPNSPGRQLSAMRALMVAHGDRGKRIWATEYGVPTVAVSEARQSAMLASFVAEWGEIPYGGPIFVFTDRDRATGNGVLEDNFGLLRTDRTPKDAAWKLAELAHFGVPTPAAYTRFTQLRAADPAWGEARSPVVPVTKSGVNARFYENTTVFETPVGEVTSPSPVAARITATDTYPLSDFTDGYQDLASGGRVYYSADTGVHVIGGGVASGWTRGFGLAVSDEIPQGNGGVKVEFQHGYITWNPTDGAVGTRS